MCCSLGWGQTSSRIGVIHSHLRQQVWRASDSPPGETRRANVDRSLHVDRAGAVAPAFCRCDAARRVPPRNECWNAVAECRGAVSESASMATDDSTGDATQSTTIGTSDTSHLDDVPCSVRRRSAQHRALDDIPLTLRKRFARKRLLDDVPYSIRHPAARGVSPSSLSPLASAFSGPTPEQRQNLLDDIPASVRRRFCDTMAGRCLRATSAAPAPLARAAGLAMGGRLATPLSDDTLAHVNAVPQACFSRARLALPRSDSPS